MNGGALVMELAVKLRKFLCFILAVFLVGCAGNNQYPSATKAQEIRISNGLTISYNADGKFLGLLSEASASLDGDLPSSKQVAIMVATIRARRQIADFIAVTLNSEKIVTQVSEALQEQWPSDEEAIKGVSVKVTREIRDVMSQRSKAILKGTYVSEINHDPSGNSLKVIVRFDVKSNGVANSIRGLMR